MSGASVRDREAAAIAVLVALCGPDGPEEWQPHDHDAGEAAAVVAAEWVRRDGRSTPSPEGSGEAKAPRPAKALPRESVKTKRERVLREQVRTERLRLNPECEGRARGIPHACKQLSDERPPLEVHEIVARSLAPGSHLVLGLTATVCQWLHDALENPYDLDTRGAPAFVGGLVLPSSAVTYEQDERARRRLPRLRPEWSWARPDGLSAGVAS